MADISSAWIKIQNFIKEEFEQKNPDTNAVLFLIGIREYGQIKDGKFTTEEKEDLINIAVSKIFSYSGYYKYKGVNEKGWPVWESIKPLPQYDDYERDYIVKEHIVEYFKREEILEL